MPEITCLIDTTTGALTLEGLSRSQAAPLVNDLLSHGVAVNCGRPAQAAPLTRPLVPLTRRTAGAKLRVYRIYHGSLTDGPGRRSVVQVAGCDRLCAGCYVPETHDRQGGVVLSVSAVTAQVLAAVGAPRDGVTVLGGEPFLQPQGLAALLRQLRAQGQHITVYSGYTLEELRRRPEKAVHEALRHTDLLIDGPFMSALTQGAGEWRGSTNQRLIASPAEAVL